MNKQNSLWFNLISWGITLLLVLAAGGFAFWRLQNPQTVAAAPAPAATETAAEDPQATAAIPAGNTISVLTLPALERNLTLKTIVPERPRYAVARHTVERGDSVFAIADVYKLKPETIYWANKKVFNGSPTSVRPGDTLIIPPVDGIYYQWQEDDTIESVADRFHIAPQDFTEWGGNNIDLSNPVIDTGVYVMLPGAEEKDQPLFIETATRASTSGGGATCGGEISSQGYFIWPTGNHYLSGYDWGQDGHRGIDIAAPEGTSVWAADNGVVTMAQSGYNNGYGNVVQIDHGNGFVTVYAHLSQINVVPCQKITAGAQIGLSGNTGNSFGAHLHFEVRAGSPINPWNVLGQ